MSPPSASIRALGKSAANVIRGFRPVPADIRDRADAALAELVAAGHPEVADWEILGWRSGDPVSLDLGSGAGPQRNSAAVAVLRLSSGPAAAAGLTRAAAAIAALRVAATPDACALVPELIGQGGNGPETWSAERWLPGVPGQTVLRRDPERRAVLAAAAAVLEGLQAPSRIQLGPDELARLVRGRLASIVAHLDDRLVGAQDRERLRSSVEALAVRLAGATVRVGWIHGDLWLGNVLVAPGRSAVGRTAADRPVVSGFVDWDSAAPDEPLLLDLLHLAVTTQRHVDHRSLGAAIAERLADPTWSADDLAVLGAAPETALDGVPPADALRLLWLQAIAANLARHPSLGGDRSWVDENIHRVVAWL